MSVSVVLVQDSKEAAASATDLSDAHADLLRATEARIAAAGAARSRNHAASNTSDCAASPLANSNCVARAAKKAALVAEADLVKCELATTAAAAAPDHTTARAVGDTHVTFCPGRRPL